MTPEQQSYVKQQLERGVDPAVLIDTLRQSGYSEELITQLISSAQTQRATIPIPPPTHGVPQTEIPKAQNGSKFVKPLLIVVGFIVIAAIALILVIAASLNDAQYHRMDASAQQMLNNSRSLAEVHYDKNGFSYAGFCESSEFQRIKFELAEYEFDCEDSEAAYRASVRLISDSYSGLQYQCADSTGRFVKLPSNPEGLSCGTNKLADEVYETNAIIDTYSSDVGLPVEGRPRVTEDNVLQAERLVFADSAKLARRYYKDNQSYIGFCGYLKAEMGNSGLEFSCMSEDIQYRVSIQTLEGSYLCLFDVADSIEQTMILDTEPTGLYCE